MVAAFDGDADRVVFMDEGGVYVDSDRSIILFARDVLAREPGAAVVYDLKCTRRVAEEVERAGGRPLRERSGYAFIKTRLLQEHAAFAGEASGHFFFREIGGDDGIYAALRMLEVLKRAGRPLSELVGSIPDYYVSPDLRLPVGRAEGQRVIERLKQRFADHPQDCTDGVRIEFERGWALCRMSVTEPALTLRFEGETPRDLEAVRERVLAEVPGA
jgi:phosphomannomutase/phosphoglucomutase